MSSETPVTVLDPRYETLDSLSVTCVAAVASVFLGWTFHWFLEVTSRVHWTVGLGVSVIGLGFFVWLIRVARRPPLALARSLCAVSLLLGLTVAVVIGGWLSYMIESQQMGMYSPPGPSIADPPMDSFLRLYYFTLADLIPLDITSTLHLEAPLVAEDFVAGLPLLAFKIFVVWYLFVEFGAWRQKRKDAEKEKSTDLAVFAAFFAAFIGLVLARLR